MLIDTDDNPITQCHYCNAPLAPQFDFSCAICTRETCDNDRQMCQEDDCDTITCFRCVEAHIVESHSALLIPYSR